LYWVRLWKAASGAATIYPVQEPASGKIRLHDFVVTVTDVGYKPRREGRLANEWGAGVSAMLWKPKNGRTAEKPHKNGKSETSREKSDEKLYRPTDKEPFMSERQREYFRVKLLDWREDILKEAKDTLQHLQDESQNHPDLADRASSETDRAIELRARDRQRKLISKIDAALQRIEDGTYGYCEETGEPITLKRLEARPIATLSIEAQERHERRERVYRDD
jgi:DnaK suppressor protein